MEWFIISLTGAMGATIQVLPNHALFVLWPCAHGDLARLMPWLMTRDVRRQYRGSRHVRQGWFKAFSPIRTDAHLLVGLRYAERNAMRAIVSPPGLACEAARPRPPNSRPSRRRS